MQTYNPEIDEISKLVSQNMYKMYLEFQKINPDVSANYDKGAAMIAFRLGLEYFNATILTLANKQLIGGAALVRSSFENLADIFYIYDKPDKYPKSYVESMIAFRELMKSTKGKDYDVISQARLLKQGNKWTNASIEDRIKASGTSLLNVYDLLSYFAHPNPGSLVYLVNEKLLEGQLNLLKQSNCLAALTLMGIVLNHSDIKSVDINALDNIAQRLGARLVDKPA